MTPNGPRPVLGHVEDATVVELLAVVHDRMVDRMVQANLKLNGEAAANFKLAQRHLEDAQSRFTRGLAELQGAQAGADLERVEPSVERERFLAEQAENVVPIHEGLGAMVRATAVDHPGVLTREDVEQFAQRAFPGATFCVEVGALVSERCREGCRCGPMRSS